MITALEVIRFFPNHARVWQYVIYSITKLQTLALICFRLSTTLLIQLIFRCTIFLNIWIIFLNILNL